MIRWCHLLRPIAPTRPTRDQAPTIPRGPAPPFPSSPGDGPTGPRHRRSPVCELFVTSNGRTPRTEQRASRTEQGPAKKKAHRKKLSTRVSLTRFPSTRADRQEPGATEPRPGRIVGTQWTAGAARRSALQHCRALRSWSFAI